MSGLPAARLWGQSASATSSRFYKTTTPLPTPRQMYGTVVLGDYLYVIGGNIQGQGDDPEGYVVTVEKARIQPDGSLGAWSATTSLPANRSYISNSTLALNDIVYVALGSVGRDGGTARTIYFTRPGTDGELEPWRESPPMPGSGLRFCAAVATPGFVHVIGGRDASGATRSEVWSARLNETGDVVGWESGPPLVIPLYFHCSAVAGGQVWVWAGLMHNTQSPNRQIQSAPILSSGRLGRWRVHDTQLPRPFWNAAAAASGPFLLSFGPRYSSSEYTGEVWFTTVQPDGNLSPWRSLALAMEPKIYIGAATDYRRGRLYIPGGRIHRGEDPKALTGTVCVLELAEAPAAGGGSVASGAASGSRAADSAEGQASAAENLSYLQQRSGQAPSLAGFIPYEQARTAALSQRVPMALYIHSPLADACAEQGRILAQANLAPLRELGVLAELNARAFPQIAQQLGVFQVPAWLFFDAAGSVRISQTGVLTPAALESNLRSLANR
ncbi:MAG: hypothetical protein Kow0059_12080 [Candidatus Sumerlaeia bacterium]